MPVPIAMKPKFIVPAELEPYAASVNAGGVRLHIYDSGQGHSTFVLVHGLGDEADSWRKVFPLLMKQGRVVAPDLPGFGRSDHPRRAYTLDFYAQTLEALIQSLNLNKPVLVGNSLGAAISLRLAARSPNLLGRLVLVDGPPLKAKLSKPQLMFLTPFVGERIYNSLRSSGDAAYATLRPYYHNLDQLPAQDQAFLRERVWDRVWSDDQRRAFFSTYRWLALEGLKGHPNPAKLSQIKIPTQIIWGDHDYIIPLESGKTLQGWIAGSRLSVIKDCGHLPQQEQPEELVGLLYGS
jgi:pimeloyl-ACP methyl ester carboxylesterase